MIPSYRIHLQITFPPLKEDSYGSKTILICAAHSVPFYRILFQISINNKFFSIEYSLDQYKSKKRLKSEGGNTNLILELMKDQSYQDCLEKVTDRYKVRKRDVNNCSKNIYHQLSIFAHTRHGNDLELRIRSSSEHETITEVAALECVFCALKSEGCFHMPLTIQAK